MFGSEILEVAIGLVMVYLVMSTLCSGVTEWIARIFALRSDTLKDGIDELLNNDNILKGKIFSHPLFEGLSPKMPNNLWDKIKIKGKYIFKQKKESGPSAVPPATFAQIVLDTIIDAGKEQGTGYADALKKKMVGEEGKPASESEKIVKILEKNLAFKPAEVDKSSGKLVPKTPEQIATDKNKQVLWSFLVAAKTKTTKSEDAIKEFRVSTEKWFDNSMQRVTGWYKRQTQFIILCLAVIICFGMNVDTVGIANSFYSDPALRETVVAAATATVEKAATDNVTLPTYSELSENMSGINLHLGWNTENNPNQKPATGWGWVAKIFGILITVFAVSMGAPFWFDLLRKLLNLRTGNKNNNSGDKT
jgi:hypothetical protein